MPAVNRINSAEKIAVPHQLVRPVLLDSPVGSPWLEHRIPSLRARRNKWMRRGGLAIAAWRRLCRGELRGWQGFRYWARHTIQALKGKVA